MFRTDGDEAALHGAVRSVMMEASERAILPRYRRLDRRDIGEKAPNELVTIADRESEAILGEGLAKILPEARVVGEEAADADPSIMARLEDSLCWVIDPLDGTGNYVAGDGPFGILVALTERGAPIGGWILDPLSGRFVAALKDRGTLINGHRVEARGTGADTPVAAISSLVRSAPERANLLRRVEEEFRTVSIARCAAEQYPAIILGKSDVTLFERTLPWDHAAGVLCLTEAGGVATRLDGSPYGAADQRTGLIAGATGEMWGRIRVCVDEIGQG